MGRQGCTTFERFVNSNLIGFQIQLCIERHSIKYENTYGTYRRVLKIFTAYLPNVPILYTRWKKNIEVEDDDASKKVTSHFLLSLLSFLPKKLFRVRRSTEVKNVTQHRETRKMGIHYSFSLFLLSLLKWKLFNYEKSTEYFLATTRWDPLVDASSDCANSEEILAVLLVEKRKKKTKKYPPSIAATPSPSEIDFRRRRSLAQVTCCSVSRPYARPSSRQPA